MHPSITVGILAFSTWRLVALAAMIVCGLLVLRRASSLGYPALSLLVLGAFELIVGLTGATLYNVAVPLVLRTEPESGLASTGGVLAMLAFGLVYVHVVLKLPPFQVADATAFALPLFLALARIGCMLNGCCFGQIVTGGVQSPLMRLFTLPARDFAPGTPAWAAFRHLPPDTAVWNLPLMLSINAIVSLMIVEVVYRHRLRWRLPSGIALGTALATEGCGRFVLEFLRQDGHVGSTPFNPWQIGVAVVSVLASVFIVIRLRQDRLPYAQLTT